MSDVHVQVDYSGISWALMGWRRMAAQLELKLARRARRYVRAPETIAQIVEEAAQQGVDHLVVSGDLTALALDEEFEGALRALGPIAENPERITVIPGNHDVFTPRSVRSRRFERWFGHLLHSDLPELCAEGPWPLLRLVGDEIAVIGLNSARTPLVPGIAAGWVGPDQLGALEQICRHPKVRDRTLYVAVHHAPLRWDGRVDRASHGLRDANQFLEVCRRGNVSAILCGHIHARYTHAVEGSRTTVVNAGSSTSLGREGYYLLENRADRLIDATEVSLGIAAGMDGAEVVGLAPFG